MDPSATEYRPNASGKPTEDLKDFLTNNECDALKAGTFTHILVGPAAYLVVAKACTRRMYPTH